MPLTIWATSEKKVIACLVADPEIVERGSKLHHMAIRPQRGGTRRVWEEDVPPLGRKCESYLRTFCCVALIVPADD